MPDLARQPLMPGNMTNRPLSLPSSMGFHLRSPRSADPLNTLHHSAILRSSAK
ncbi:hypothetical protein O23A_p4277 [Aeromonas salmonicida]|nr:hypothetical protein O23A_p4277 [Aeromonas salmonicida]